MTWRLLLCLVAVVSGLAWSVAPCSAQDIPPGKELPVPIHGSTVEIRFRWCPPGEIRPGDPDADAAKNNPPVKIDGFYLSETEITQAQFRTVLGQEKLNVVHQRILQYENEFKLTEKPYSKYLLDDYPVFMVTIREAVEFCAELETMLSKDAAELVFVQVRIPVNREWQYACLARETPDPNVAHFGGSWPADWRNLPVEKHTGKVASANLEKFFQDNKLQENFSGTQTEVVAMLRSSPKENELWVLETFLRRAVGLDQELGVSQQTGSLRKAVDSNLNNLPKDEVAKRWNLHHMHTNASEWTWMLSNEQADVQSEWSILKRGDQEKIKEANVKVGRVGGSFVTRTEWNELTAWNVVAKKETERQYPANAREQEDWAISNKAGIRLVYRTKPADTWLVQVRSSAVTGDERVLIQARDKLLPKLSDADKKTDGSRIDFYSAVAKYQSGDKRAALKAFQDAKQTLAAGDSFFDQYELLLANDITNP